MTERLRRRTRVTGAERDRLAEELKERYNAGESIRELATSTGRSFGFVHRILVEAGVNLRGRGGVSRKRNLVAARRDKVTKRRLPKTQKHSRGVEIKKARSVSHTGAELRAALAGLEPPDDRFVEDIEAALKLLTAEENSPWGDG